MATFVATALVTAGVVLPDDDSVPEPFSIDAAPGGTDALPWQGTGRAAVHHHDRRTAVLFPVLDDDVDPGADALGHGSITMTTTETSAHLMPDQHARLGEIHAREGPLGRRP